MKRIRFTVPDMTCTHCEQTIKAALLNAGAVRVKVNLKTKEVMTSGDLTTEGAKMAVRAAGYTVEPPAPRK